MGGPSIDPAGFEQATLNRMDSLVRSLSTARDAFSENVPISFSLDDAFEGVLYPESELHVSKDAGTGVGVQKVRRLRDSCPRPFARSPQ